MADPINSGQAAGDGSLESAHAALRADPSLQFKFGEYTPPPTPGWLEPLIEFLKFIAPVMPYLFWGGVIVIAALLVYNVGRALMRRRWSSDKTAKAETPEVPEFRPSPTRARTLLEEADRLAREGRYSEAVRVLLHRSIEDIGEAYPMTISPALTSREIARLPPLSAQGRAVFSGIAEAVETSLFGGRPLDAERFAACRQAYERFAFAGARA